VDGQESLEARALKASLGLRDRGVFKGQPVALGPQGREARRVPTVMLGGPVRKANLAPLDPLVQPVPQGAMVPWAPQEHLGPMEALGLRAMLARLVFQVFLAHQGYLLPGRASSSSAPTRPQLSQTGCTRLPLGRRTARLVAFPAEVSELSLERILLLQPFV